MIVLSYSDSKLRPTLTPPHEEGRGQAGLSQKVISNLENAEELNIHPTIHTLISVAEALKVSLFVLMTRLSDEQLENIKTINGSLTISRVIDTYMSLSQGSRQTVDRILDLEARATANGLARHDDNRHAA